MQLTEIAEYLRKTGVPATYQNQYIEVLEYRNDYWVSFHIIPWAPDPQVPVLYFAVFTNDNTPIKDLTALTECKDISRTVHPINQSSAWFIHPCNTRTWLETMHADKEFDNTEVLLLWYNGLMAKLNL